MNRKLSSLFSNFCLIALFLSSLFISEKILSQVLPPGFSQVPITKVNYPTAMDFAPDGRIFVCEKAGKLRIVKNGVLLTTPFCTVDVDQMNERGLDGVVIDPDFETNHYVYIYYTAKYPVIHNRLSRFTANGDVAVAGSEKILLDLEPVTNSIHNGGGMVFGNDGKLYLAVGEDHIPANAQDMSTHKGKILRLNKDGSIPTDNPFTGSDVTRRIWALGFRNPYTLAIQRSTGRIFVNDVGEFTWEEINEVFRGKNYGWPNAEGMSNNPSYVNPVYTYQHNYSGGTDGQACAVTGGTFFNPPATNYPSHYIGDYFFIDYCGTFINYLDLNGDKQKHNFGTQTPVSRVVLQTGTDGNLYFFSLNTSTLYKIVYTQNNSPVITSQPKNISIPQGQPASFTVTASGAQPLSYQWRKNGVNISGANGASYTINNTQSSDAGTYSVVVSNAYGNVTSNNATLTVTAYNAQPTATILSPGNGALYRAGDVINFSGSATDPEDGTLPSSAYNWTIEFHHDTHLHPGPSIPSGVKSGSFTIPVTGETSANVYYRIILTVTDSKGLTDQKYVDIFPRTSNLSIASNPSGLQIKLDDQPKTATYTEKSVSGMIRTIGVVSPQTFNGLTYVFDHWVHGGAATQDVKVGDSDITYTAVFKTSSSCATGNILREYWSNVVTKTLAEAPFYKSPTGSELISKFEGPTNAGDNYVSRIRGYICPPQTGNYYFYIASDNNSELYLSTDNNPANKRKIASVDGYTKPRQYNKYPGQKSSAIYLISGQSYYIEAIHREGGQGDNLSVAWILPNGTMEAPVPGTRLSPYNAAPNQPPLVTVTSPKEGERFSTPVNITLRVDASDPDGSISKVEFFLNDNKVGEVTAQPYEYGVFNLTTGNYVIKAKATDDKGASTYSSGVNIVVTTCATPTVTAGGATTFCSGGSVTLYANTGSGISYQWKRDGVNITGATASSYKATISGDYQVKTVQGSCIAWSAPVRVTVNNCRQEELQQNEDNIQDLLAGISEKQSDNDSLFVKVYPNPNNGLFTLEVDMLETTSSKVNLEVINAVGQVVFTRQPVLINGAIRERVELDSSLPTGIYILRLQIGERIENTRVLLTK